MQEKVFYISELIQKKLYGSIAADEEKELNEWITTTVANKKLYEQLTDEELIKAELEKFDRYDTEKNREYLQTERRNLQARVNSHLSMKNGESGKLRRLWKRIAVAASIVGVLFVAGYFISREIRKSEVNTSDTAQNLAHDVAAPDKNRAMITLADGSTIYLDSTDNGELVNQHGVKVMKTEDGRIIYETTNDGQQTVLYNTLSNPRGSKVQALVLDDGTKVWLNAASSITYPTAFIGNERKVTMTGEAYFEVTKSKNMPFIVSVEDAEVQVLGTHFNIMAYKEENAVKTTLLEGSVRFVSGNNASLLKPGQQSQLTKDGQVNVISGVDVDEVMAWKNGLFYFKNADIETVMRQLSRWYDVDIQYQGEIKPKKFGGEIQRDLNLSEVLEGLKETGIHFRIEGKKLIVLP